MTPPRPARPWLWLGLCLCASVAQADPEPGPEPEEVDADVLDFLGSWQNDSGRWVDPIQIWENLPKDNRLESKTDTPGLGTSPRTPSKGRELNRNSNVPRDPMRMQTGP